MHSLTSYYPKILTHFLIIIENIKEVEMKSYKIKSVIVIFAAVSILALQSCTDTEGTEKPVDTQRVVYVKTQEIKYQPFVDYISLIGIAKAEKKAEIASDEGGIIKEYIKEKGQFAREGEIILIMDNDILKASLDAAKAQYDLSEINFKKQEQIYKDKVTSELQYLNSKYERDAAKANYDLIKVRYDKTFIKAPFSGVVDHKYYEEGEIAPPGVPIISFVKIDNIKIEAGVPENYVNGIKKGDKVKIVFNDLDGATYYESLSYVGNTLSPNNRTFPVEILINNRDKKIKPELNARVFIERENFEKAIVVPEEVLARTDYGYVVYAEEDGIAKMHVVEVISRYDNKVAIKNGLKEGQKLIVVGHQNLVNGEKVKAVN
jgi:membrane fusion protein (multidrug efflux system)